MKLNKQLVTVGAVSLVAVFFCMNTLLRQGDSRSSPVRDDSILKNTPVKQTEARQDDRMETKKSEASGIPDHDAIAPQGKAWVAMALPKPFFQGTPKEIRGALNLEPPRDGKLRNPIFVPVGCEHLLSRDCEVTSSDPDPIIGELSYITDGDKEYDAYVELAPGTQWVQVDLGEEREIYAACVWHFHGEPRVYRDVVCQISNDPDFIDDVVTVFNNDHDNSSKLGAGKDKEYLESNHGRPFAVNAVKARYVRFYSRGNTTNEVNHYTEIEVYGKGD